MSGRARRHLTVLAVWSLVWALFFGRFLLGVERLSGGDLFGQFYAFARFQAREMAQGRLPIWSPGDYGGFPFAADTQAAVFYPIRWLTILFSSPWGFSYYALELEALAHVWLAGVFTYALCYAITRHRLAGLVGAVTFGLGGYLISYPISQLAVLETVAWLPLILLLIRLGVRRERRLPYLIGAGLAWSVAATAGHPQTLLHLSYLSGAYYLFLTLRSRWRWSWILGLGALVAVAGVGGAMAALLPALRYVGHTLRSDVGYTFVSGGLEAMSYIQALVPAVWTVVSPQYIGLGGLCLALLAWRARNRGNRAEIVFWVITALIAMWLALGDKGVLFQLVYHTAPGFSLFRRQERLVSLASLSGAILAAQGMSHWLSAPQPARRRWMRWVSLVIGLGLFGAGFVLAIASDVAFHRWQSVWLRQMVVAGLILLLLWGQRRRMWRALGVILLLALDLHLVALDSVEHHPGTPAVYDGEPAWIQRIERDQPSRIDSDGLFYQNVGTAYGVEDIHGLSPLKPRALEEMEDVLSDERRWQLLNVTHVLTDDPPKQINLTHVYTMSQTSAIYRFEKALPRAWMSYHPVLVSNAVEALDALQAPAFDPATDVIVPSSLPGLEQIAPPTEAPAVTVRRRSPSALIFDVTTESTGLLAISEWLYPGWRATLDGEPVPLHLANYAFQTLVIPPGDHHVELRFAPWDVWVGAALSLLTMIGSIVLAHVGDFRAVPRRRRERRPFAPRRRLTQRQLPWRWIAVGVILLGFGLRAFRLGGQELRGDEAVSYVYASLSLEEIAPYLVEHGNPHPPLHYVLMHSGIRLLGSSEFSLRYLSLLPSLLLLPVMYQVGRHVLNARLGLLLLCMMAISAAMVRRAQDARNQYTLSMLFSTWATLLLVRALQRSGWKVWAGYTLTALLTVYSHYFGVFVLIAHGIYLATKRPCIKTIRLWVISGIIVLVLFLPWMLYAESSVASHHLFQHPPKPDLASYLVDVGAELAVGSALPMRVARWIFLAMAGLAVTGYWALSKRELRMARLCVGWVGLVVIGIFLIRFRRITFNEFYVTVAAPAWWILIGYSVYALWQERDRFLRGLTILSAIPVIGFVGIVVSQSLALDNYYNNPKYSRTNGYRRVRDHLASHVASGDVFLFNFPDPVWTYYLEDVDLPFWIQPTERDQAPVQVRGDLSHMVQDCERLWFVPYHHSVWDPDGTVYQWLETHALLEQSATYGQLDLLAYRPPHTWEAVMTPIGRSLDDRITLVHAFLTADGRPVALDSSSLSLSPGAELRLSLVWRAHAKIEEAYTVFVHLLDEEGHIVAQHDGWPVDGMRPTFTWEQGEELLDVHRFTLPRDLPSERATLVVGLYHSEMLTRQTFDHGHETIHLADVTFDFD